MKREGVEMGEIEYRLKNINELEKIKKQKETQQKVDLLDLFTTYIYMTNPDYKYNETYLKDMIPSFWNAVSIYTNKLDLREKILNKVQPITTSNDIGFQIQIQLDETWELNYISDSNSKKKYWEKKISDNPKLNSVDYKKTYIKCKFMDINGICFSDYIVADVESDIIQFVINLIKLVKDRKEV